MADITLRMLGWVLAMFTFGVAGRRLGVGGGGPVTLEFAVAAMGVVGE